jgi:hypothetical protein
VAFLRGIDADEEIALLFIARHTQVWHGTSATSSCAACDESDAQQ